LKPKLTYDTGRNPHEDFSKDDANSRYPNIPQDRQGYKKVEKQEDLQWSPPTRRQEGTDHWLLEDRVSVVRRHLEHFLAQLQDNLEEWFLLGLTCALVVRKRRGLSRQIWRAYQDRSINVLVYHPPRTASSRLKVCTNIKLQDATPRIEDSISIHEGSDNPKTAKATRETSTLQVLNLWAENFLSLKESFRAY
jgi:hypothetical protein